MLEKVLSTITRAKTAYDHIRAALGRVSSDGYSADFTVAHTVLRHAEIIAAKVGEERHPNRLYLDLEEQACTTFLMKTNGYTHGLATNRQVIQEAVIMMSSRLVSAKLLWHEHPSEDVRARARAEIILLQHYIADPLPGKLMNLTEDTSLITALRYRPLAAV